MTKRTCKAVFLCFAFVFEVLLYDIFVFHDGGKSTGWNSEFSNDYPFLYKEFSFKRERFSIFFIVKMFNFLFTSAIFSAKIEATKCGMVLLPFGYKMKTSSFSKKISSRVYFPRKGTSEIVNDNKALNCNVVFLTKIWDWQVWEENNLW